LTGKVVFWLKLNGAKYFDNDFPQTGQTKIALLKWFFGYSKGTESIVVKVGIEM